MAMNSFNKSNNDSNKLVVSNTDENKSVERVVAGVDTLDTKIKQDLLFGANGLNTHKNILNGDLQVCSLSPLTGFTRTGKCDTNEYDQGTHLVCASVTKQFLDYTKSKGNDLSTPNKYFPGLKPGDNWCLCVYRWVQAYKDGYAPPVVLNATHYETLDYLKAYNLNLDDLKKISS